MWVLNMIHGDQQKRSDKTDYVKKVGMHLELMECVLFQVNF